MAFLLLAQVGGRELRHVLGRDAQVLGSAEGCDWCLPDPTVSRRHARVEAVEDRLSIEDLGSRNGTVIGGIRIAARGSVLPGECFRLGEVEVRVHAIGEDDLELALPGASPELPVLEPPPAPGRLETIATAPWRAWSAEALPVALRLAAHGAGIGEVAGAALRGAIGPILAGAAVVVDEAVLVEVGEASEREIRRQHEDLAVLLRLSARGDTVTAESVAEVLLNLMRLIRRQGRPRAQPGRPTPVGVASRLVGQHPLWQELSQQAAVIGPSALGVLIEGESGTGKELFARALHEASGLPAERFVALNCAALPRDLLDAELFGIEAGVATGVAGRPGRFELADGGTLFLDEIADMAPETQARLLRVLQEGEVWRIGGTRARPARARIIAACNRSLQGLVEAGSFRLDLYHRVADCVFTLPPLRARGDDIGLLAAHFLEQACTARGIAFPGLTRAALAALKAYSWPGNVRELEREMTRVALFLSPGSAIDSGLLKPAIRQATAARAPVGNTLAERLEAHEREILRNALADAGGQVTLAAERLGIGRSTLYRRLSALGIESGE